MPQFTKQTANEISRRFKNLAIGATCPVCKHFDLGIVEGFFTIPVTDFYPKLKSQTEREIVCAGFVCKQCGNMIFVNLKFIGLEHLVKSEEDLADGS
jgi:hypothetical protein